MKAHSFHSQKQAIKSLVSTDGPLGSGQAKSDKLLRMAMFA